MTTTTAHRYTLQKCRGNIKKATCPACGQKNRFVLYIDNSTGNPVNDQVGRCDRESSCGYHLTPAQFAENNPDYNPLNFEPVKQEVLNPDPSYISSNLMHQTLSGYDHNNFVKYLLTIFDFETVTELITTYKIGTSKYWPGASVFWQVDTKGRIRTGKIMLYNPETGKRVKEPFSHIQWVHKTPGFKEYELRQCFFGEHLIKEDLKKQIAIVESEKTAIIASVYLPQFIWLASGSLNNLSLNKCNSLQGRKVVLFPDVKGYDKWVKAAETLKSIVSITVSDLLETKASVIEAGYDLADYLITFDISDFKKKEVEPRPVAYIPVNRKTDHTADIRRKEFEPWDITEIENYFASAALPQSIRLNSCSVCDNVPSMVNSHLQVIRANNGNPTFKPYLNRLISIKESLIIAKTGHSGHT